MIIDEDGSVIDNANKVIVNNNKDSTISPILSKKDVNLIDEVMETIQNIDEIDSGIYIF